MATHSASVENSGFVIDRSILSRLPTYVSQNKALDLKEENSG